jgi:HPt (histidine-containing phosphotransfer) domain-containing protein
VDSSTNYDEDLIDQQVYNELLKYVSKEELHELYKDYLSELDDYLKNLQTAVTRNNIAEILSILHSIKGSSATLGLKDLAQYALKIETSFKEGASPIIDDFLTKLLALFSKFKDNYERLLK